VETQCALPGRRATSFIPVSTTVFTAPTLLITAEAQKRPSLTAAECTQVRTCRVRFGRGFNSGRIAIGDSCRTPHFTNARNAMAAGFKRFRS
jgi:hypothetical protein